MTMDLMNTRKIEDLSILTYKQLQTLAAKYNVPGNCKKSLLVNILQAVRTGNTSEFKKLLTESKKPRKKKVKRLNVGLGLAEKPSCESTQSSPDLTTHRDLSLYSLQNYQQHFPFQWVGAEEEVDSTKFEQIKGSINYDEMKQFILSSAKDRNNNGDLINEIIDLRTSTAIATNHHQTKEINSGAMRTSKNVSMLLKKMLQAPAGANLVEIATPVTNWPLESLNLTNPERAVSPDTSVTLTAKSDIDENDEIWQERTNHLYNGTGLLWEFPNNQIFNDDTQYRRDNSFYCYQPEPNNIGDQASMNHENQSNQFNYSLQANAQENCRSWIESNSLDLAAHTDFQSRSMAQTEFEYTDAGNLNPINSATLDNSTNVLHTNGGSYCLNDQLYAPSMSNRTSNLVESSDIVPNIQFDESRFYQTPPEAMTNEAESQYQESYNRQMYSVPTDMCSNQQHHLTQTAAENNINSQLYSCELEPIYNASYYSETQPPSSVESQALSDPLQQPRFSLKYEENQQPSDDQLAHSNLPPPPAYGTSPVLKQYWPNWLPESQTVTASRLGGCTLENILNLNTPYTMDLSNLNEMSCVSVCCTSRSPIMTLRCGENSVSTIQEAQSISSSFSEHREHSFVSNWLLYNNDTNGRGFTRSVPM